MLIPDPGASGKPDLLGPEGSGYLHPAAVMSHIMAKPGKLQCPVSEISDFFPRAPKRAFFSHSFKICHIKQLILTAQRGPLKHNS